MRLSTVHLRLTCICVLLSVLLMFAACGGGVGYPARLVQADSLLYDNPDSALHILESYNDSLKQASTPVRMYYDLLLTTAKDKCYITHTSDSTALQLVSYYEKHGPGDKLALAYYITGRVYDDLQNTPVALEYYQKAVDEALSLKEYRLLGRIYIQMGMLYFRQNLDKECVSAYMKSYKYGMMVRDSVALPAYFRNMGLAYTLLDNIDSTLYYYEKAFKLSNEKYRKDCLVDELSSIYMQLGDYKNVRRILSYNKEAYDSWADYYVCEGQTDSAKLYYGKVIKTIDNVYKKEYAYYKLAEFARSENKPFDELQFLRSSNRYKDSILEHTKTTEVKRIEALYNTEKIKAERDRLAAENLIQIYLNISLLSMLGIAAMSFFIIYKRAKHRKQKLINQEKRVAYLKEINKPAEPEKIENLPLCNDVKNKASKSEFKLLERDWERFQSEMNSLYPNFVIRLRALYPQITDIELTVCCLVKLGIRNTDMANILSHRTNSISNIRKRLYEKIHSGTGSARQLDEFIAKL